MSYEALRFEIKDSIAIVTLNRPDQMNAWNGKVATEISKALVECDTNNEIRAVVITGAGRAFCAGTDFFSEGEAAFGADDALAYQKARYSGN